MDLRCVYLLIACFYSLEKRLKDRITEYLDSHRLDSALYQMIQEKLFPEWFSRSFFYDPLYGRLDGLQQCFADAYASLLISMEATPVSIQYRLNLSQRVIDVLIANIPFEKSKVEELAKRLNELLSKQKQPI